MKIVFTTIFRDNRGGGAGRISYEIPLVFARCGYNVMLIRPGAKTKIKKKSKKYTQYVIQSSGDKDVSIPLLTQSTINNLFKTLEQYNPDIIHAHDEGPIAFLCQYWANANNVPFIFTKHVLPNKTSNFIPDDILPHINKILSLKVVIKYLKHFTDNCDAIIALNKPINNELNKLGYINNVYMIPNGRYLKQYYKLKIPNIESNKKIQLIYIGDISERKNQKYLAEVMKFLDKDKFHLTLVGDFLSQQYAKKLIDYIKNNNVMNITLTGKVSYRKTPKLLELSHVFISASTMEVQSLAVIEALAAGKPIIALKNETTNEFIKTNTGILLHQNTEPKEFAGAIKKICQISNDEYLLMCRNARISVSNLDWPNIARQTMRVYKNIIKNKKKLPNTDTTLMNVIRSIFGSYEKNNIRITDTTILLTFSTLTTVIGTSLAFYKKIIMFTKKITKLLGIKII